MQNPSILRNYYMLSIALDSWGRTTNDASGAYTLIEGDKNTQEKPQSLRKIKCQQTNLRVAILAGQK